MQLCMCVSAHAKQNRKCMGVCVVIYSAYDSVPELCSRITTHWKCNNNFTDQGKEQANLGQIVSASVLYILPWNRLLVKIRMFGVPVLFK